MCRDGAIVGFYDGMIHQYLQSQTDEKQAWWSLRVRMEVLEESILSSCKYSLAFTEVQSVLFAHMCCHRF